jgi:hypothetical protein
VSALRLKLAARVKPEFGPALPELLGTRFGAVPRRLRSLITLLVAAVIVIVVLETLHGAASSISDSEHGVSFGFNYSGLAPQATPAGQYALLAAHRGNQLVAELEVGPLRLPAYGGNTTGVEPLVAANYMSAFMARTTGVVIQSAGPTLVNGTAGYNFTYTRRIARATYFGRVIFLTPSSGSRTGVTVSLLAQPVLAGIIGPGASALAGALYEPGQGGVGVLFQPAGLLSLPLATFYVAR